MSKFKVGDSVFHVGHGMGVVRAVDSAIFNGDDAIEVDFYGNTCQRLCFTLDGRYSMIHKFPQLLTLKEARAKGYDVPKQKLKKQLTVWVNIYATGEVYGHNTKELADKASKLGRVACVEKTFEYEVEE